MSRVFVAREEALGREVVIKVIKGDLAEGLRAERFAREVKLAARLQQANIVPVLTAGTAGDVPYYTMPFVTPRTTPCARNAIAARRDTPNVVRVRDPDAGLTNDTGFCGGAAAPYDHPRTIRRPHRLQQPALGFARADAAGRRARRRACSAGLFVDSRRGWAKSWSIAPTRREAEPPADPPPSPAWLRADSPNCATVPSNAQASRSGARTRRNHWPSLSESPAARCQGGLPSYRRGLRASCGCGQCQRCAAHRP